jgi:hypothetical protein
MPTQHSIIAFIRRETQTIDMAIEKAQREMDLMREYRETVIGRLEISA